jgi:hypothetical protein
LKKTHAIVFAVALLALVTDGPLRGEVSGELSALGEVLKIARDNSAHESLASVPPANCTLNAILANLSNGEEEPIREDLQTARKQYETAGTKLSDAAKQKSSEAKLKNWPPGNKFQGAELKTKADVLQLMASKSWDSMKTIDDLLSGTPVFASEFRNLVSNASDLNILTLVLYDLPEKVSAK